MARTARQALAALEDPLVFALVIAFGIFVEACLLLAVSGAGGALAAKASVRKASVRESD